MALLDVQTSVLANQAMNYLVSGTAPGLTGNTHPNVVPYQPFETSDGRVIVAVGNDGQFARFAALLGMPELAADPDYKTNAARIANRERLIPLLLERTRRISRHDLLAALEREGVPGGPINDIAQTLSDPHVEARGLQIELEAPHVAGGRLAQVRSPIVIDGEPMVADRAPPALGADDADWRWH
jgi:crotonobetainyl-CoA:carnitine CoA-transferase CaiB-like acyl-CoA transferase